MDSETKTTAGFMARLFESDDVINQLVDAHQGPVSRAYIPPCEACQHNPGTMSCSRCKCACYCSKECQVKAWKSGHKKACATMKKDCIATATQLVQTLGAEHVLPMIRFDKVGDLSIILKASGPYKEAVKQGLYDIVLSLFKRDAVEVADNFRNRRGLSYTSYLMRQLFGGVEIEGANSVDIDRFNDFFQQKPKAFDAFMTASFAIAKCLLDAQICAHPQFAMWADAAASDVRCAFSTFMSFRRTAKLALLGFSGQVDQVAMDQAHKLTRNLMSLITELERMVDTDLGIAKEETTQNCLLLHYRFQEFGIGIDLIRELRLKQNKVIKYQGWSDESVKATIAKDAPLSETESNAAIARFWRQVERGEATF